ncbi:hypothetical protein [Lentilactobacillus kribbianus]|uniref:hypothetical protein n=1 Tax=Lentilactobacillus kribbianus TaxID=2729622 RepID=UPI001554493B|nr:hypothetical protein [Lentilactobacillus kribbianus]
MKKWVIWTEVIAMIILIIVSIFIVKDFDDNKLALIIYLVIAIFVARIILTPLLVVFLRNWDQKMGVSSYNRDDDDDDD